MKTQRIIIVNLFYSSILLLLVACSPQFNWRESCNQEAAYRILLPAKPSTFSRSINLNGLPLTMTMTAAKVNDTIFAVGYANLPDARQAPAALQAIKFALVKNINGVIKSEQSYPTNNPAQITAIDIEASGTVQHQSALLRGRLVSQEKQIYQIMILGQPIAKEQMETFFTSFQHTVTCQIPPKNSAH